MARVWLEVFWAIGLESGGGPLRGAAVHVRHDRVFAAFAGDRGAAVAGSGGVHYGNVSDGAEGNSLYGLWAIFVLVPILRAYVQPFLGKTLGWTGLFSGPPYGIGMLAAGVILAIMIIPIISSITREVLTVVPQHQREAVLALGATRWEMIRMGVLRNARAGIVGAVILGLGRALGETMAVTMVIGNRPEIAKSLFAPGYTMASVLANEFTEATGDLYLSALIEIGLALFFVTIVVNALARIMVWSVTRGQPARSIA
jgi:phosphate transport system permease protein